MTVRLESEVRETSPDDRARWAESAARHPQAPVKTVENRPPSSFPEIRRCGGCAQPYIVGELLTCDVCGQNLPGR